MFQDRFKITPASYLILTRDNEILLSRRCNTKYFDGCYGFPSGHLEGEETFKQAMIRESKEEIDADLSPADLELIHVMNRKMPDNERVDLFFAVRNFSGEIRNREPEKCDDLKWFGFDSLPPKIVPSVRRAIDCFRKGIIYSEWEGEEKGAADP